MLLSPRYARQSGGLPPELARHRAAARLQVGFRNLLARRAAQQARRLLVDDELLRRLAAVISRTEWRSAETIQWRWRVAHRSEKFRERVAAGRVVRAMHRRRARIAQQMLEQQAKRQQIELRATIRLQAALRRRLAAKFAAQAAKTKAVGLLRQQWGTNREERAVGRVQRAWVASVARRREAEAEKQAETASCLSFGWRARARVGVARAALCGAHCTAPEALLLPPYRGRRRAAWVAQQARAHKLARTIQAATRYYWVSAGALRYDSVERRMAHLHGWPLRDLVEASALKRRGEFALVPAPPTTVGTRFGCALRRRRGAFWWRWMRWLAHLSTDGGPQLTALPAPSTARPQRQPPRSPSQPHDQLAALAALRGVEAARTGEDLVVASVQRRLIAAAHARVLAAQAAPPAPLPAPRQQLLGRSLPLHEIQPPPLQASLHRRRRCGNRRCSRSPSCPCPCHWLHRRPS